MRTDDPVTDDELHDLLRRTFDGVARATRATGYADQTARRRRWLLPVAAAAVVAAGAVGVWLLTGGERQTRPAGGGSGPLVSDFSFTPEESAKEHDARMRMTRDCMATRGQPYPLEVVTFGAETDPFWGQIGRTNADLARRIGYQPEVRPTEPSGGYADYVEDPTWQVALSGHEDGNEPDFRPVVDPRTGEETFEASGIVGGCELQVWTLLYGDLERFLSVQHVVNFGTGFDDYDKAPEVTAALRRWSECMSEKGYDYREPFDPIEEFSASSTDEPGRVSSADEIRTAVDDVACKQSAGVLAAITPAFESASRAAAAESMPYLAEYRRFLDHALAQAAAFEAGDLRGPWRDSLSPDAPANTARCTWLPDGPPLDMSVGEIAELTAYLHAVAARLDADRSTRPETPPPWLLNAGSCVEGAAAQDAHAHFDES